MDSKILPKLIVEFFGEFIGNISGKVINSALMIGV